MVGEGAGSSKTAAAVDHGSGSVRAVSQVAFEASLRCQGEGFGRRSADAESSMMPPAAAGGGKRSEGCSLTGQRSYVQLRRMGVLPACD